MDDFDEQIYDGDCLHAWDDVTMQTTIDDPLNDVVMVVQTCGRCRSERVGFITFDAHPWMKPEGED
jgi:hypothetical protein